MLYEIAHIIKDKFGFLWDAIEWGNATLFSFIYGKKLKEIPAILKNCGEENFTFRETTIKDVSRLATFFQEQPEEAFDYFMPHGFDEKSISKVLRNKAFLTYVVEEGSKIVGYFFMRSFVNNKTFKGYLVDYRQRGKGIACLMGIAMNRIDMKLGLRMFKSISPDNPASLAVTKKVNDIKILKTLDNGDLYLECFPKEGYY